jgi:hypothetical protein
MAKVKLISLILMTLFLYQGCITTAESEEESEIIYPMFVDNNSNNINDYVEQTTHEPGPGTVSSKSSTDNGNSHGEPGHSFTDDNEDGICDYWDESHSMHSRHEGMRFHDENENHINDYFEEEMHWGAGHKFIDADGDGICDLAQDGSPTWHGPGFVDMNVNGMSDHWENGGRGHGGMMGGGHN